LSATQALSQIWASLFTTSLARLGGTTTTTTKVYQFIFLEF